MEKDNNNLHLLIVIGILTLLIALIGTTFAAFSAVMNKNRSIQDDDKTIIKGIIYDSSPLQLINALPGTVFNSNLEIFNPNKDNVATYDLVLITDTNTLLSEENNNELILTISGSHISEFETIDLTKEESTNKKIVLSGILLEPGLTDSYNIKIEYKNQDVTTDINKLKTYIGHIGIVETSYSNEKQ